MFWHQTHLSVFVWRGVGRTILRREVANCLAQTSFHFAFCHLPEQPNGRSAVDAKGYPNRHLRASAECDRGLSHAVRGSSQTT